MKAPGCQAQTFGAIWVVAVVCACFVEGCVIPIDKKWVHDPPLSRNLGKIVKGQTTRDEILRLFGPPDIEADGPRAKASANLPLFRMLREATPRTEIQIEYPAVSPTPYSSIDSDHVAFLYLEEANEGVVMLPGPSWASSRKNKLLIFIDKRTNLVDEFAYSEQFKAE